MKYVTPFNEWREPDPSEEYVTLYRGDSESAIQFFSLDKTNIHSLFGRGIYFTEDKNVAATYRHKGGTSIVFKTFTANDWYDKTTKKDVAIERFIKFYVFQRRVGDPIDTEWFKSLSDEDRKPDAFQVKYDEKHGTGAFEKRMEDAKAFYEANKKNYQFRIQSKNSSGTTWTVIEKDKIAGEVTPVRLPTSWIEACFDADEWIDDEQFIQDFHKLVQSTGSDSLDRFMEYRSTYLKWPPYKRKTVAKSTTIPKLRDLFARLGETTEGYKAFFSERGQKMFRDFMKKKGYKGIRYAGGRSMGNKSHNAYVFWDEQGINRFIERTEAEIAKQPGVSK